MKLCSENKTVKNSKGNKMTMLITLVIFGSAQPLKSHSVVTSQHVTIQENSNYTQILKFKCLSNFIASIVLHFCLDCKI
jgi:hypothetical protein